MPKQIVRGNGRSYTTRTPEERREILHKVWELRLRSFSTWEIAKSLNLPQSTVCDHLKLAKKKNAIELFYLKEELILHSMNRKRKLWCLYSLASGREEKRDESGKVIQAYVAPDLEERRKCLQAISEEEERLFRIALMIGTIPKVPDKHEVSGPDGQPLPLLVAPASFIPQTIESPQLADHGNGNSS